MGIFFVFMYECVVLYETSQHLAAARPQPRLTAAATAAQTNDALSLCVEQPTLHRHTALLQLCAVRHIVFD